MPKRESPPPRCAGQAAAFVAIIGGAVAVGTGATASEPASWCWPAARCWSSISLFWTSIQDLSGESELTLDEALGMAAPSAEEERKRSVLRALKDLEYERSVGKISEDDFAELSQQLSCRSQAPAPVARREHQAEQRERVEQELGASAETTRRGPTRAGTVA